MKDRRPSYPPRSPAVKGFIPSWSTGKSSSHLIILTISAPWGYPLRDMAVKLEAPAVSPSEMIEEYRHGFHDTENYVFKSDKGLTRDIVERISAMKDEPAWMRDFRLKAYDVFMSKPMPTWG